jgi:hypothetical protein
MLSAILLSIVLIHCELMPRGKIINNEQKKRASICLIFDCLHVWSVQDRVEELSVTLRITGWGSSVTGDVQTTWSVVQSMIITIPNFSTLINTRMPSLLLVLNWSVRRTTLFGKQMCHQNPKVKENPPAPSNKLSSIVVAKGVQGIKWAMGIFHLMPESGLSLLQKNSML